MNDRDLNDDQLFAIVTYGRRLVGIEDKLSEAVAGELVELQQRAGHLIAGHHSWQTPEDYPEMTTNPSPITMSEVTRVLTTVFAELHTGKDKVMLRGLMRSLGITPPDQEPGLSGGI